MYNAKTEEAFTEIELPEFRTTGSRREEDQIPLVKNSSRGSTLYGSHRRYCTSSWRKVWFIVVFVIIALVIGLAVGLPKRQKYEHEHPKSVAFYRIPFRGEHLLNMIIEDPTRAH